MIIHFLTNYVNKQKIVAQTCVYNRDVEAVYLQTASASTPIASDGRCSEWQMLSCSPERYSVYTIQIWLTETESALTAGHLTISSWAVAKVLFKMGRCASSAHRQQVPKAQHSPTEQRRPQC